MFRTIVEKLSVRYDVREARALAFILLEDGFGVSRTDVFADKVRHFSEDEAARLQNILLQMEAGVPLQYALGRARFCSWDFLVTPDTLIPRPETEELVEWTVECVGRREDLALPKILDCGTGTGCIAIALSLLLPAARVEAWDVSEGALRVARQNAERLRAAVEFLRRDVLTELPTAESFDFIVSNPPYICESESAEMEPHVLEHEPYLALFVPDDDALIFYRALCRIGQHALRPEGMVLMEVNRQFANEVARLFAEADYADVELRHDQFGQPRMVAARWRG